MIIRKAKISDLNKIIKMYSSCVKKMISVGIDQWDETYPDLKTIKDDINSRTYYIASKNNIIVGGVNIDKIQDRTYLKIDWEDKHNKFLVVHRLAVDGKCWKNKIGKKLMLFAEKKVLEKKLNSIRLDTYSNNPQAILFYELLGYKKLGSINLKPNKNEYYCFEKIIK
jgi:N-acetylglutamate synthase-like GNAT family acetyltransferase